MSTVSNVVAPKPSKTGGVRRAPLGTALPTDAAAAPDAALVPQGYVGEDGLVFNPERSTDKVKAWGGDIVKVIQSEFSATFQFTLIEVLNAEALKASFGTANVTTTAADTTHGTQNAVKINGDELPHEVWVFDMFDGQGKVRFAVPDGQVTNVAEINFNDTGVSGFQITMETFEDENGNNAYLYTDDGVLALA